MDNDKYNNFRKYATIMASTQNSKLFVASLTKEPESWNLYSDIDTGNEIKPENKGLLTQLLDFVELAEVNNAPLDAQFLQKFFEPKRVIAK